MNFVINLKTITLANGYSLSFDFPIKNTLTINDIIVIVVESPFDVIYRQNVFAIKTTGDFLWRIDDIELCYTGNENCFYVDAELNDKNELILYNWCDSAVIVEPETGDIIRKYQTK